ncbi:MAG: response regulator [Holophagaceae bacterium]|nr:response regulator [Holophagaceae bacterium]
MMPTKFPTKQILLVDTDVIQSETISDILRSEGMDVLSVWSGDEATNALRQKKPPFEVVITNLVMPNKDGVAVVKAAIKYNSNCSVMVLSTFSSNDEAIEAIANGAFMVITKPFHPAQFRNALLRLIERANLISDCNYFRTRVEELESKVNSLETTKGRMEMLAQHISPSQGEQKARSLNDIEQLATLRSKGILTEEQFQSARQSLLTRWLS